MPYYLVTHTSLVEADSEVRAAEDVLAKIQQGSKIDFLVKLDEENTKHVVVSRQDPGHSDRSMVDRQSSPVEVPASIVSESKNDTPALPTEPRSRLHWFAIGVALFGVGVLVGATYHVITG
jgi:hypothetical protein